MSDINLLSWGGLGDVLATLPIARRAWLGAQYRKLDLIARHYRAPIQQVMINNGDV